MTKIGISRSGRLLTAVAGTVGVTVLSSIALCAPAGASTATVSPTPPGSALAVATGPYDQVDPHVSDNLVTYTDFSAQPSQIRYHDLRTGIDAAIPAGDGDNSLSAVSGSTVVYVHRGSRGHAIYSYDTASSAAPTELDPQVNSNRRNVAIGGATVAWQDFGLTAGSSPEIVAYDRATGRTTRLTADALLAGGQLYDRDPAVDPSGTVISWTKCVSLAGGCDVWDATLQAGVWTTRQLTNDSAEEQLAHTNGSVVVYSSDRGGDWDIRWQPVGGGAEQSLSIPGTDLNAHISGHLVTFEHYQFEAATPHYEIYAYDLSTGALYRLTQGTYENNYLNDVWTGPDGAAHVVWTQRTGDAGDNVYGLSFVLPGTDAVAPSITITSPADSATYLVNQVVAAAYTCVDEPGGSGTASCQGNVPVGAALDTATVGTKTFSVTGSDNAGNSSTKTAGYTVGYRICALFDQTRSYRSGSTIPVKLQICDATGANVSAPARTVVATTLAKKDSQASPNLATASGNANPDNNFRYDAGLAGYIYNLSTKGLATGTWVLSFTVTGDPTIQTVQFDVR